MRFEHETLPQRVCFATGEAQAMLAGEVVRLDASRVMVIASAAEAGRAEQVVVDLPVVYRHDEVVMHVPVSVIYDAELTLSLPVELSVASGLNGLAHCIDSMWAPRADPINGALAVEGIRALATGLPAIATDPHDVPGREQALYGAYLSAVAFASAGSGLHHKICHVLGGAFDLGSSSCGSNSVLRQRCTTMDSALPIST